MRIIYIYILTPTISFFQIGCKSQQKVSSVSQPIIIKADSIQKTILVSMKIYFSDSKKLNVVELLGTRISLGTIPLSLTPTTSEYLNLSLFQGKHLLYQTFIPHPMVQTVATSQNGQFSREPSKLPYKEFLINLPYLAEKEKIVITEYLKNTPPRQIYEGVLNVE